MNITDKITLLSIIMFAIQCCCRSKYSCCLYAVGADYAQSLTQSDVLYLDISAWVQKAEVLQK